MSVAGGWILVPLVLSLLILGHGLAVERLCGLRLPPFLLPSVGLASLIAVSGLVVLHRSSARLVGPLTLAVAVAGVLANSRWRHPGTERRELLVAPLLALAAFMVFAAPSLLTGQASITGYLKLDDSATWLVLTDHVMERGRSLEGLPPTSYRRTLETWLGGGYPVGSFLPLGVSSRLAGQDPASAYQSVIAVYAAVLGLGVAAAAHAFLGRRRRAAVVGLLAVQASVFYGYAQWGGIKEAAAAALLPPLGVLATMAWREGGDRALAVTAVVGGAVVGVLGVNGVAWAGPALAVGAAGVVVRWWRSRPADDQAGGRRRHAVLGGIAIGIPGSVLVMCSTPALATINFARQTFVEGGAIAAQSELGNLLRPLPLLQAGGLWPQADFRGVEGDGPLVVWLALICVASALGAAAVAVRRRHAALPVLLGITAVGAVPALVIGSPWVDAKAMAIVSPVVLGLATVFALVAGAYPDRLTRTVGRTLLGVLAAGAVWSTVAMALDAYVAPRGRFAELRALGQGLAGQGPTLVLDFEIYADRYFLRDAESEGATDLRYRTVRRRDGNAFPYGGNAEVDDIAVEDLWEYRTIVRRRSPVSSRPPIGFELVHATHSWEAWQRASDAAAPLERLALGGGVDPTAVPACADVERLAATPGAGRLVGVRRRPPIVVALDDDHVPRQWRTPLGTVATENGTAKIPVGVSVTGRYRVWVGGAVLGRLEVGTGGRALGTVTHDLAHAGQWMRFDEVDLTAGAHEINLAYAQLLRPDVGYPPPLVGPVALTLMDDPEVVVSSTAEFRRFCDGSTYDWIEAVQTPTGP